MQNLKTDLERRTATDHVFDNLHEEIMTLKVLPGTKMSEAEIAERFGISRQPVRDAFNRLDNLDLLLIRPQRATVVRGFSMEKIAEARFLRLAAELEVIRNAGDKWDDLCSEKMRYNLQQQRRAADTQQWDEFQALDIRFHVLFCELGECWQAIDTINSCRRKTARLCVLSFTKDKEVETVIEDHRLLIEALDNRDIVAATDTLRQHLSRLDSVIAGVQVAHSEYFE